MSPSPAVDQASRNGEDHSSHGADGGILQVRSGEACDGSCDVAGHHRESEPGADGHELPRREMGEAGAHELGDALLDDRVPAVIGLDLEDSPGRLVTKAWS